MSEYEEDLMSLVEDLNRFYMANDQPSQTFGIEYKNRGNGLSPLVYTFNELTGEVVYSERTEEEMVETLGDLLLFETEIYPYF